MKYVIQIIARVKLILILIGIRLHFKHNINSLDALYLTYCCAFTYIPTYARPDN